MNKATIVLLAGGVGTGLFFLGGFAGTALGYIISSTMNISDTVAADEPANPSVGNV